MKFYIADNHFHHANMIKYEKRPFVNVDEMDTAMINNWNSAVGQNDDVYIVGDLAFCSGEKANYLLDRLRGRKYFISGNHDSFMRDKGFDKTKFVQIREMMKITDSGVKIILCHYPMAVWDCEHHGALHFYGHIHRGAPERHPHVLTLKNAFNVGADILEFTPRTMEQVIEMNKAFNAQYLK